MTRCGCNPVPEPFEFKLPEKTQIITGVKSPQLPELFPMVNNLQELKNKIICEFLGIIDNLECGIRPDLEFLLEEISLVEIEENG